MAGIELEALVVVIKRRCEVALFGEGSSKIAVSISKIWVDCNCLLEVMNRFFELAKCLQG